MEPFVAQLVPRLYRSVLCSDASSVRQNTSLHILLIPPFSAMKILPVLAIFSIVAIKRVAVWYGAMMGSTVGLMCLAASDARTPAGTSTTPTPGSGMG